MSDLKFATTASGTISAATPIALVVAAVAALAPIAGLSQIPLVDAPNHLARLHIMRTIATDPDLAEFYELKDGFYPYYGMRLVVGLLAPLIGVEPAGHVFAMLALLLPALGTVAVARAIHGRLTVTSVAAFAFSMNMAAGWGFLNFLFSLGVVLLAFAAWIRLAAWPRRWRISAFLPVIFTTGCIHLMSAGVLFGLIAVHEFCAANRDGPVAALSRGLVTHMLAIAVLAVPVMALSLLVSGAELGQSETQFGFGNRLEALFSPFFLALGNATTDRVFGLGALLLLYIALRERIVIVSRPYGRMLMLMVAAAALAPVMLSGVYGTHLRLPLLIVLVLVAAMDLNPVYPRPRRGMALAALALGLTAAHLVASGLLLHRHDRRITELRQAARLVERGAKVLPAIDDTARRRDRVADAKPLFHIASYLVIDRGAFLPTLFGMYEVGVREPYRPLFPFQSSPIGYAALTSAPHSLPSWARLDAYDYVLVLGSDAATPPLAGTQLLHAGADFRILKVLR